MAKAILAFSDVFSFTDVLSFKSSFFDDRWNRKLQRIRATDMQYAGITPHSRGYWYVIKQNGHPMLNSPDAEFG